jgi:hypothetical protein
LEEIQYSILEALKCPKMLSVRIKPEYDGNVEVEEKKPASIKLESPAIKKEETKHTFKIEPLQSMDTKVFAIIFLMQPFFIFPPGF